ncbi:MAG: hypothetical protein IKO35_02905, partial [Elusimicrobiaceae bacterium]|nr:hypothetical protein [Elusimicrobiaceae bacterium]
FILLLRDNAGKPFYKAVFILRAFGGGVYANKLIKATVEALEVSISNGLILHYPILEVDIAVIGFYVRPAGAEAVKHLRYLFRREKGLRVAASLHALLIFVNKVEYKRPSGFFARPSLFAQ